MSEVKKEPAEAPLWLSSIPSTPLLPVITGSITAAQTNTCATNQNNITETVTISSQVVAINRSSSYRQRPERPPYSIISDHPMEVELNPQALRENRSYRVRFETGTMVIRRMQNGDIKVRVHPMQRTVIGNGDISIYSDSRSTTFYIN